MSAVLRKCTAHSVAVKSEFAFGIIPAKMFRYSFYYFNS
jgi:hypothetical protein